MSASLHESRQHRLVLRISSLILASHRTAPLFRPAQEVWPEVLRCISRFDLVGQGRSEASLFAAAAAAGSGEQASPTGLRASLRRGFFSSGRPGKPDGVEANTFYTMLLYKSCIQ